MEPWAREVLRQHWYANHAHQRRLCIRPAQVLLDYLWSPWGHINRKLVAKGHFRKTPLLASREIRSVVWRHSQKVILDVRGLGIFRPRLISEYRIGLVRMFFRNQKLDRLEQSRFESRVQDLRSLINRL